MTIEWDEMRRNKIHDILDAFLIAMDKSEDKDAFVTGFLCAVSDIIQYHVVLAVIEKASQFAADKDRAQYVHDKGVQ